jgi:glycosyltransferase involved in cell wall biosynthesis
MPDLCFITTCRGRLAMLKQSLPTFARQPGTSCIVVDYDCPEGTAVWVEENYPQVKVVRAGRQPRFELSRARNLGAAQADAPWLCFVDADICLADDFASTVLPLLEARHFFLAEPRGIESWGTCIAHRDDFNRIEGYDDVLQGWGTDDVDFYTRLRLTGVRQKTFPGQLLRPLNHDEQARVEHYEIKDQWLSASANRIYCRVKWDLIRMRQKNIPRDERQKLYDTLRRGALQANATGEPLEIKILVYQDQTFSCGRLEASLHYRLPEPQKEMPGRTIDRLHTGE